MNIRVPSITGTGGVPPETHQQRAHGPFQLRRIRPGITLGQPGDPGFGGLGTIDHAKLQSGLVVRMHEHRNDEIISYMRAGQMRHTDSGGHSEGLCRKILSRLNAALSLWTHLCCELRKDLEWRAIVICKLLLADHMRNFDARDCR